MPIAKTIKRKTNKRKKMVGGENDIDILELFDRKGNLLNTSGVLNKNQKQTFDGIIELILNKGRLNTLSKALANVRRPHLIVLWMNKITEQLKIIFDNNKPLGLADDVKQKFVDKFSHTTDKNLLDAYVFLLDDLDNERGYKYIYDGTNKTMKRVNDDDNIGFDGKNGPLKASTVSSLKDGDLDLMNELLGIDNNQKNNEGGKTVKNRKLKQTRKKAKTNRKKHQKQSRRK